MKRKKQCKKVIFTRTQNVPQGYQKEPQTPLKGHKTYHKGVFAAPVREL
jgi:hypothetical protein